MDFSILVTTYDPQNRLQEMREQCLEAIKKNSKGDYELILDNEPGGIFKAYNRFFKKAKGQYLVITQDDVLIQSDDWLQQLAVPGYVTSWHVGTWHLTGNSEPDGEVWCYPRDIQEKIGLFDESFDEGYGYGDNDYFH